MEGAPEQPVIKKRRQGGKGKPFSGADDPRNGDHAFGPAMPVEYEEGVSRHLSLMRHVVRYKTGKDEALDVGLYRVWVRDDPAGFMKELAKEEAALTRTREMAMRKAAVGWEEEEGEDGVEKCVALAERLLREMAGHGHAVRDG